MIEILIDLWYIVYRWRKLHTIKKEIPSFDELGTIPKRFVLVPTYTVIWTPFLGHKKWGFYMSKLSYEDKIDIYNSKKNGMSIKEISKFLI